MQKEDDFEVFEVKCNPGLSFAYKKVPSEGTKEPAIVLTDREVPEQKKGRRDSANTDGLKEGGKPEYVSIVELDRCLTILAGTLMVLAVIVIVMFAKLGGIKSLVDSAPRERTEITDEQIQ